MALRYMVQVATPVPVNKTVARPTCKIAGVARRVFLTSRKYSWTVLDRLFERDRLVLEAKRVQQGGCSQIMSVRLQARGQALTFFIY